MKKYLFFILALAVYTGAFTQVSHSYTFAVGDTNGVTLSWDAFSDELDILGCLVYKKVKHDQAEELISPEMVISDDSAFVFNDYGEFDPVYPPVYSIHVVTPDSVFIADNIYAFSAVDFEILSDKEIVMEVVAWNNDQCCAMIMAWLDGILQGTFGYDSLFRFHFQFNKSLTGYGNTWFQFDDNNWHMGVYANLILSSTYIQRLAATVNLNDLNEKVVNLKISPNPASTQAWLQLPENLPLNPMQIELYSPTGRLLYKEQPQDYFHKIEVAHLPKGLYLVRVWDGKKWLVEKLVVGYVTGFSH